MADRGARLRVVAFALLTGVLAVMVIATLLLLRVEPHLVFMPGFMIKSWCKALGFNAPNAVGVVSTSLLFWGAIVVVWLTVARVTRQVLGKSGRR